MGKRCKRWRRCLSTEAGLGLMKIASRNGWHAARGRCAGPGSGGGARSQGRCAFVAESPRSSDWMNREEAIVNASEHRVCEHAD